MSLLCLKQVRWLLITNQVERAKSPLRLGARLVVELLERNVAEDDFPYFSVSQKRDAKDLALLQRFLTDMQKSVKGSPYVKASIKSLVHQKYGGPGRFPLSRMDLGAINLVDSMFDEMLEKGRFDSEAWELIAKTKIPVLKLIVQDLSFLFMPKNVARKFVNSITLALISSASGVDDPDRAEIGKFIDKIVHQYDVDVSIVNIVCIDAQSWFAGNQQRLSKVQDKIVRSESSKNKKVVAEPRVVDLLNKHFAGTEQPELMHDFISGAWREVLRAISIEDGEGGSRWKRAAGMTESMATFYRECGEQEGQAKYQRFLPTMLKTVRMLIGDTLKNGSVEDAVEPFELIASALVAGAVPGAVLFDSLLVENKEVEVYERKTEQIDAGSALDAMSVGDWVRIKTSRSTIEACKLTVKSSDESPWIFVNQSGKKIAKKTREELDVGLKNGTLHLIGKGVWVDDFLSHRFDELNAANKIALPPQMALEPKREKIERSENSDNLVDAKSAGFELVREEEQASSFHSGKSAFVPRTADILLGSELSLEPPSVEEGVVVVSDDDVEVAPLPTLTEEELDAAARAVLNLQVSGWVMVAAGALGVDPANEVKLKLAVIVKGGTKYIFVNRLGIKQLEIDKHEFSKSIAMGDISIVDNGVQFSSALEKVVRNIQKEHR